jgi:hypothetical protein
MAFNPQVFFLAKKTMTGDFSIFSLRFCHHPKGGVNQQPPRFLSIFIFTFNYCMS